MDPTSQNGDNIFPERIGTAIRKRLCPLGGTRMGSDLGLKTFGKRLQVPYTNKTNPRFAFISYSSLFPRPETARMPHKPRGCIIWSIYIAFRCLYGFHQSIPWRMTTLGLADTPCRYWTVHQRVYRVRDEARTHAYDHTPHALRNPKSQVDTHVRNRKFQSRLLTHSIMVRI